MNPSVLNQQQLCQGTSKASLNKRQFLIFNYNFKRIIQLRKHTAHHPSILQSKLRNNEYYRIK